MSVVPASATPLTSYDINFANTVGTSPYALTTYKQGDFVVTNTGAGTIDLNPNQGNPAPGLSGGLLVGGGSTDSFNVTDPSYGFYFDSIDLGLKGTTNSVTYVLTGTLNGVQVFSASGTDSTSLANSVDYTTYSSSNLSNITGNLSGEISQLNVTVTNGSVVYVDNIVLTAAPEPSSLMLLGTGILGVSAAVRRRIARK